MEKQVETQATETTAATVAQSEYGTLVTLPNGVYRGTVSQFIKAGIKLNGMQMDAVSLSALGRYKLIPQVAEHKPARGRSAAVYEIKNGNAGFEL